MGFYTRYVLPRLINTAMKSPEFAQLRGELVPAAEGRVLELGVGSGLNLPFYGDGVQVTGVDPSVELQAYAREVARECRAQVEFVAESAESLPFGAATFDSAVVTWTLCSIENHRAAIEEVHRVLKPGGRLIFAEHGRSPEPSVERWQNRINPLWRKIGGGCNLNRRPDRTIADSGFRFDTFAAGYLSGPRFAAYHYRGIARRA